MGLSQPYRLWGVEKECQTCSFRSSSRKINQFRVKRYIVDVSLLTLQEQSSQTGQNFVRCIRNKTKTLCSTDICLLTTKALYSFNLLFFRVLLQPQQNEIQLVSRFFLSSKPFGPGNWIQSLAMPISHCRGEDLASFSPRRFTLATTFALIGSENAVHIGGFYFVRLRAACYL